MLRFRVTEGASPTLAVVVRVTAEIHDANGLHQVGHALAAIGASRAWCSASMRVRRMYSAGVMLKTLRKPFCSVLVRNTDRGGDVGDRADVGDVVVHVVAGTPHVPGDRLARVSSSARE